jgi:hypothetical protein
LIGEEKTEFTASLGWFSDFRKCHNFNKITITEETTSVSIMQLNTSPQMLQEITSEGGDSPRQIFLVGVTGLFWKRMPL